ncbi:hypothetical protein D3C77_740230 [compost metagenome]
MSCNWRVADWMALPWLKAIGSSSSKAAKSIPVEAAKCATPASALAWRRYSVCLA